MNYLLLNNAMGYLSDARYDQFQKWGWLRQFLFIIINWIADLIFGAGLPLFGVIMAYTVVHPLRCVIARPSYISIARLDMQDLCFNINQQWNNKLLKGREW